MSKDSMVTVTVAKGKSIQQRKKRGKEATAGDPIVTYMPGQQCEVPAHEVERLIKRGFIVDPDEKALPKGAEDVDITGYFKTGDGAAAGPQITQAGGGKAA